MKTVQAQISFNIIGLKHKKPISSAKLLASEAGLVTIRCVYAVSPSNTLETVLVYAETPAITLDLAAKTATLGAVSPQSPAVYPETGAGVAHLEGETPCLGAETRQTNPKTA